MGGAQLCLRVAFDYRDQDVLGVTTLEKDAAPISEKYEGIITAVNELITYYNKEGAIPVYGNSMELV